MGAALVQTSEAITGGHLLKRSIAEHFHFSLVASSPERKKADGAAVVRSDALVEAGVEDAGSYFFKF